MRCLWERSFLKETKIKSFKGKMSSNILYWRRQWHPTPVLLPGKSHGRRSLVGCSPWDHWGSDMTERLHFHFSFSLIGEGNGNPLQCSCLENPRDGEAWWAAFYGVTQSRRRLKWLSNSNSNILYIYKSSVKDQLLSLISPLPLPPNEGASLNRKYCSIFVDLLSVLYNIAYRL